MEISSVFFAFFAAVSGITSTITSVGGIREDRSKRVWLATQRRMMQRGYRRNRDRNRGKALSVSEMLEQIEKAHETAMKFAQMLEIVNSYEN